MDVGHLAVDRGGEDQGLGLRALPLGDRLEVARIGRGLEALAHVERQDAAEVAQARHHVVGHLLVGVRDAARDVLGAGEVVAQQARPVERVRGVGVLGTLLEVAARRGLRGLVLLAAPERREQHAPHRDAVGFGLQHLAGEVRGQHEVLLAKRALRPLADGLARLAPVPEHLRPVADAAQQDDGDQGHNQFLARALASHGFLP